MTAYRAVGQANTNRRIVGLAAHRIVPRAERTADDHGDLRHDRVRHRIHHLRASLDDAAPLRIAADHESIDIMEKNQRDQVLVAIHDEAGGFFRGFGIDDAAELNALVAFVIGLLRVQFLIGDDSNGKTSDPAVAADKCLAVLGLVFIESASIDNTRARISFMS